MPWGDTTVPESPGEVAGAVSQLPFPRGENQASGSGEAPSSSSSLTPEPLDVQAPGPVAYFLLQDTGAPGARCGEPRGSRGCPGLLCALPPGPAQPRCGGLLPHGPPATGHGACGCIGGNGGRANGSPTAPACGGRAGDQARAPHFPRAHSSRSAGAAAFPVTVTQLRDLGERSPPPLCQPPEPDWAGKRPEALRP